MKKNILRQSIVIFGTFALLLINSCDHKEVKVRQEKQIKSDHIISHEFGSWKVKHVFDKDSLSYQYSNAKTTILLSDGEEFPFLIYRRDDHYVSYLIPGCIEKVIITIDGVEFTDQQAGTHTFHGEATNNLFITMANTKSDIKIEFFSGDEIFSGTINPTGLYAALKWIRVIE